MKNQNKLKKSINNKIKKEEINIHCQNFLNFIKLPKKNIKKS